MYIVSNGGSNVQSGRLADSGIGKYLRIYSYLRMLEQRNRPENSLIIVLAGDQR